MNEISSPRFLLEASMQYIKQVWGKEFFKRFVLFVAEMTSLQSHIEYFPKHKDIC